MSFDIGKLARKSNVKGKTTLITGADGFIGSHLTEMLVKESAKVKALSYYNSFNHWGWLEAIDCLDDIEVLTGDIRDPYYCQRITKDVDIIFHLAALIAIPYSYISPESYVITNIKGTHHICEAALINRCERLILTSTSEVYGTARYVPIDENHPFQPQSPYSASKIGADALGLSYYYAFDLPVTIARPFNTYGPRQSARAIIPTIITQIASGVEVVKVGDLSPTRDLTYVEDTCRGLIALACCNMAIGETVNIGSNYEISMREVLNIIKELMQADRNVITEDIRFRPKKSEVYRLVCNNSKMRELTGFTPRYSLREGLERTINWFIDNENLKKYRTNIYNV